MLKRLTLSVAMLGIVASGAASADSLEARVPVEIREWLSPYYEEGERIRDPFAESSRAVWFVGQKTNFVGRLNPESGEWFRLDLEDRPGPHNVIVGSDGIAWIAGNQKGYIGRYDPESDTLERIQLREDARDPHTMIFDHDEERIWFTIQHSNMVGSMDIETREFRYTEPFSVEASRPYGIEMAPDGTLWVAHFGTNMVSEIDPGTMEVTEYRMPSDDALPRRITVLSNGDVYYGDFARGTLGLVRSGEGFVTEWDMPRGDMEPEPYLVLSDSNDIVWAAVHDSTTNYFVGFDPRVEDFVSVSPVPSEPKGQGHIRHGHYHEDTGSIWYGSDSGTIGQVVVDK